MSADALPDGFFILIKSTIRAQVQAMAVPGSTGPERVNQLTGISRGTISRWCGDGYADLPSLEIVFMLEHHSQKPVISRALAQLSSHRLTPIAEDDAPDHCLVRDLVEITGSSSRLAAEMSSAIADGTVTPAEAKCVLRATADTQDKLTRLSRTFAAKATV